MREEIREDIAQLESDIEVLEEKIRSKISNRATALARAQARIFLERIFDPYMSGVCNVWGVTPEEGLRIMIEEGTNLGMKAKENPAALADLLNQPEIQIVVGLVSPLRDVSEDWIKEKSEILYSVMRDIRPELAVVIAGTPGGTDWFYDSLTGLWKILFGVPQLNIQTP